MKIYTTQKQVEEDIKDDILAITGDVTFECSIEIEASIVVTAGNITAGDITARDITAGNITAGDIIARNITAGNITAWDITAWDITAWDITAGDINARNITAGNITAWDISFYAVCFAYAKFICRSVKGRRENARYGCLDSEVQITK